MVLIKQIIIVLFFLFLAACSSDECREYSKYTCDELEKDVNFNVLFYFPHHDDEYYLGSTKGLSACQDMAYGYADEKNLSNNANWSYVCCVQTEESDCEESHQ